MYAVAEENSWVPSQQNSARYGDGTDIHNPTQLRGHDALIRPEVCE